MTALLQDLRYAIRRLGRSPGFTTVALLTLALGIGANSAIFSVVHAVLLRPLPFAEDSRLLLLYTGYPDDDTRYPLSPPDFMSLHDEAQSFSGVAATSVTSATLTGEGEATRVAVSAVSRRFFDIMGVAPILGRTFSIDESRAGEHFVVMLEHAFWRQRFGADPEMIGRTLTINGEPRTVVGVLPPGFDFPDRRELYVPLVYDSRYSSATAEGRRGEFLLTVGRLQPGVGREEAATEVRQISDRLQQVFPGTNGPHITLTSSPLRDELLGDVRTPLLILLGAVGLVLLIACVNVANLLLSRAAARRGEMSVRMALGAGRGRLVRQLLTESLALGVIGGVGGLLIAILGIGLLVAVGPEGIPRLDEVGLSGPVVAFTAVVAIATGLLFGVVPAMRGSGAEISGALREVGRSSTGSRSGRRARRTLVVAEIALALVLLVGSGLLIRGFLDLTAADPGFRSERLLTFELSLPAASYVDGPSIQQFYARLLERVEALPGVESAAAAGDLPLGGSSSILGFSLQNRELPSEDAVMDAVVTSVTPGYFSALGISLNSGRVIAETDHVDAVSVVVVNEAFVRRYLPGEDPLGERITFDGERWREIVGVVGDVPQYGLDRDTRPAVFPPHEQFTTRGLYIVVQTAGDPESVMPAIRQEVAALDPNLPIQRFTTGTQLIASSVAQPRFYATLLTIFAGVALVLATVGLFAVISMLVTQRTREIGVRIALGADSGSIARLVTGEALGLCAAGAAVGTLVAIGGSRALSGLLFGIGAFDPITYVVSITVLMGVGALASYLPTRAAIRVDPNVAMRSE